MSNSQLSLSRPHCVLLLLIGGHLLLSLPSLWVPFYNIDELTNAIHGQFLLAGDLGLADFVGNAYFLTHYLYAALGWLFGFESLWPIHAFHAIWKIGTLLALYWTGTLFWNRQSGLWSAIFYICYSYAFMSKDFHTPSAESFSLLPASLAVGFFFQALLTDRSQKFLLAGVFAALATLFKYPMGVTVAAMLLVILLRAKSIWRPSFWISLGFLSCFLFPAFWIQPFPQGFVLMYQKLTGTNLTYIQSYEEFSFLYWFSKFVIRSFLVFLSWLAMTVFAVWGLKRLVPLVKIRQDHWQKLFFLFVWLIFLMFVVTLGKRIFYHYFVFLLPVMSLLAGYGLTRFDEDCSGSADHPSWMLLFLRRTVWFWVLFPTIGFGIEGAVNYSTRAEDVSQMIKYIQNHTKPDERIYIWGNVPQLYFYGQRLPATPYFWSDILAGTNPGSPAMEYVRATGETLSVAEKLWKDFDAKVFYPLPSLQLDPHSTLHDIHEHELFTLREILQRIRHPYWQKVFYDFFKSPPVLFIDSSPRNIRGFGYFPIHNYELLKRFVMDNYRLVAKIDGFWFIVC